MNKVILMGRLTRDPEVRYSQGAEPMAIARYTLAVDRRGRRDSNEQNADFISCVAFGRAGEFAEKYLHQGTKIVVTGRIQTGTESKNSQTGGNRQAPPESSAADDGFMNIPDGIEGQLPFN